VLWWVGLPMLSQYQNRYTKQTFGQVLWPRKLPPDWNTPLSSLIGWVELLKTENMNESTTFEIEKMIEALANHNRSFF
jgi:hypothetical protein